MKVDDIVVTIHVEHPSEFAQRLSKLDRWQLVALSFGANAATAAVVVAVVLYLEHRIEPFWLAWVLAGVGGAVHSWLLDTYADIQKAFDLQTIRAQIAKLPKPDSHIVIGPDVDDDEPHP